VRISQTDALPSGTKPAIVTARRKPERILPPGLLAETPEEHQRRGDAVALWRELVRRATGGLGGLGGAFDYSASALK
jgi:hypothetical protein